MMMMISSPANPRNETTSSCPSWKLYENPFYYPQLHPQEQQEQEQQQHQQCQIDKHFHHLHLPRSTRKIAASFWDLTFFRPIMESELEYAQAQIIELKTKLEYERKTRKKAESMNKRLARELLEERRGREAMERVCEELAKEISSDKAEINRMKREMEEERKMLRVAEVLREERVQMKLTEAKILFEEKLLELEEFKEKNQEDNPLGTSNDNNSGIDSRDESTSLVSSEKSACNDADADADAIVLGLKSCNNDKGGVSFTTYQRKASPEPENPHIKRGIKGFVEFPRVVRAIGSKSRPWGTKLECQQAQLRILLKQRSPIRSNNLIMS